MHNFESVFISFTDCSLFIWSEMLLSRYIYALRAAVFNTFAVLLSCPQYVIATMCVFVFSGQIKVDSQIQDRIF